MCQFISFAISKDGSQLLRGPRLDSHEGIESMNQVKPGTYFEAEWVGDGIAKLTVRTDHGHSQDWYKAAILGIAKTRRTLFNKIMNKAEKERVTIASMLRKAGLVRYHAFTNRFITAARMGHATAMRTILAGERGVFIGPMNKKLKPLGYKLSFNRWYDLDSLHHKELMITQMKYCTAKG